MRVMDIICLVILVTNLIRLCVVPDDININLSQLGSIHKILFCLKYKKKFQSSLPQRPWFHTVYWRTQEHYRLHLKHERWLECYDFDEWLLLYMISRVGKKYYSVWITATQKVLPEILCDSNFPCLCLAVAATAVFSLSAKILDFLLEISSRVISRRLDLHL